MDKVFIRNLHAYGILGVHAYEQTQPRLILVSVTLSIDISRAAAEDNILATINYSSVAKAIRTHIEQQAFLTIEALIESLAQLLLEAFPADEVWLRVEKPDAVQKVEAVGVEITRTKTD